MAKTYNICLDVGGTKVLGAIFDAQDQIIYRLKKRTRSGGDGSADVEQVIIGVVEEMIRDSGIDPKELNAIASCAPRAASCRACPAARSCRTADSSAPSRMCS
jgi:glucokinase